MTLDQYQLCPCGSGKKIKFCCSRDFVHDLDRIHRMVQGEQRMAAMEKIDALLEKFPDRPALLMVKAEVELQLNEARKSRQIIERLAQVDPKNPSVPAMRAVLSVMVDGNVRQAINWLQDAFELIEGSVTARMYEAIVLVATALLRAGRPAASKGHLQLALALSGAKDEHCAQALMQLNHSRQIPLLLREPLSLRECPPNVTWRIEFEAAMRDIYRGRWRLGARQLAAMSIRILDAPAILFNQAVVQAWLADNENAVRALRDYARIREVSLDERVYAAALAEELDPDPRRSAVDIVQRVHSIDGFDRAMEKAISHPRLKPLQLDPNAARSSDQPLPRAVYQVLDRPLPKEVKELQASDIPESLGMILLYGRETDKPARIALHGTRVHLEQLTRLCDELVEKGLSEPPLEDRVIDHAPWLAAVVLGSWVIPDGVEIDDRRRLQARLRDDAVVHRWPHTASPVLDGKTPTEAAADSKYKPALLGSLLNLEILAQDAHWEVNLNDLRQQLGLPLREPLDPSGCDFERLPVHQLALVDATQLTDEQLLAAYRRAYAVMAVYPLRKIALELIGRPSLDEKVDKVEAYDILSDVAPNTDEALEYLDKARKLATSEGESPAAWLIDELEIRLLRGEADKFVQLLKEIQTRYMNEPGIAPSLMEVLSRYGLVTPDGRFMVPAPREMSAAASQAEAESDVPGLWTPDSGIPAAPSIGPGPAPPPGEEKPASKLWMPGMD